MHLSATACIFALTCSRVSSGISYSAQKDNNPGRGIIDLVQSGLVAVAAVLLMVYVFKRNK